MDRELDGFEPGDRVVVRKAVTSGRTEQTVWEVAGLADDGRTVLLWREGHGGRRIETKVRAAMLWLVQTVEERMAAELMRKPEPPRPGRPGQPSGAADFAVDKRHNLGQGPGVTNGGWERNGRRG